MSNIIISHRVAMTIASDIFHNNSKKDLFALQLFFYYMNTETLKELIQWFDRENNIPYQPDISCKIHFQFVAECMLRYYYNRFEKKHIHIM
jgi:hypothetical protein